MSKILFVGCGKMGGALLRGAASRVGEIFVVEPGELAADLRALGNVRWERSAGALDPSFFPDVVVLAVKPQHMSAALPCYRAYEKSVFLSIAAGKTLAQLELSLGNERQAFVRAMPNLPVSVGQGISVAVAGPGVTDRQRSLCETVLQAGGAVAWVEDESLIDAVTALSGSGPAYVFALAEAMAAAGEALGLPQDLAERLARQTVVGSGALLRDSAESASALRVAVTSPGGTTEAALETLLGEGGLPALMRHAMRAAAERSRALSGDS